MTRVGLLRTILKQSVRVPKGWRTFSMTEETVLPKIKSEEDADSVFGQPRHCVQRVRARRLHC